MLFYCERKSSLHSISRMINNLIGINPIGENLIFGFRFIEKQTSALDGVFVV